MNKYTWLVVIVAMIAITPFVSADYSFHTQYGNDQGHQRDVLTSTAGTGVTRIDSPYPGTGSYTEPLAMDVDNDGRVEVFVQGTNGLIVMIDGDNPSNIIAEVQVGDFFSTPALCDVDNDGDRDYVAAINNGSSNLLIALDVQGGDFDLLATRTINQTNIYGNIACGRFYSTEGDPNNYAMFVSANKRLYIQRVSASSWTGDVLDVDGAIAKEAAGSFTYNYGSHVVVYSENFDVNGENSISFLAGDYFITYTSDGEEFSIDYTGGSGFASYASSGSAQRSARLLNPGSQSTGGKDQMVGIFDGDSEPLLANPGSNPIVMFKMRKNIFGFRVLDIPYSRSITAVITGDNNDMLLTQAVAYNWDGNSGNEVVTMTRRANTGATSRNTFSVWSLSNLSEIHRTSVVVPENAIDNSGSARMYAIDYDKDGFKDLMTIIEQGTANSAGVGGTYNVTVYYGKNYTVENPTILFQYIGDTPHTAPVPVDINMDGGTDFIHTVPGATFFLMSSVTSTTAQTHPFTVALNNTIDLTSIARVTAGFTQDNTFTYNYAIACDIGVTGIWSENFRTGYNFSTRNVSLNIFPPEDYLVFDGLQVNLGGNITQLNVLKEHTVGLRDYLTFSMDWTRTGNYSWDTLMFSDTNFLTEYWRFNVTDGVMNITQIVPGQGVVELASVALVGSRHRVDIKHQPARDTFNGIEYFTIEIVVDGTTAADNTSTFPFDGVNIQDVQLFTQDPGIVTLHSMSMSIQNDPEPSFVLFQNRIRTTIDDITIETPPPQGDTIAGDGFTVLTGLNETFYGVCEYDNDGTYTQRHYLAPVNTIDYTNFHEITVTVAEGSSTVGDTTTTGDTLVDGLTSFLDGVGLTSAASKLLFWMIITFFIVFWAFKVHWMAGLFAALAMLVVGVLFNMVPLWVLIVLVIACAGVIAVFMRFAFSG